MASKTTANGKKAVAGKNVVAMNTADIPAQIETLRNDVAELTQMIKVQAKAAVVDKTSTARETATETVEAAKDKYDELTKTAENRIKESPLTAVAIAVGAGLLLGAITRR